MKDSVARQPATKVSSRSYNSLKGHNGHPTDKSKKKSTAVHDQTNSLAESGDIINSEEIQKLSIKDEDLQMVRKSLEMSAEKEKKSIQTSRYVVKKQKPPSEQKKEPKKVIVARSAPPDAELKPIDYSGPSGPRYNHQTGEIIPHTLLGSVEDFISEAVKQNYIEPESRASLAPTPVPQELTIRVIKHEIPPREPLIRMAMNQEKALLHWQRRMAERKRQQGYISKLLQKPVDRLVMHKDDEYRKVQEQRKLVDRAIPALDYGKGCNSPYSAHI